MGREGFEPSKAEGRQIYSLLRLTASLPPQEPRCRSELRHATSGQRSRGRFRVELAEGIEPPTRSLQNCRSTPELRQRQTPMYQSGKPVARGMPRCLGNNATRRRRRRSSPPPPAGAPPGLALRRRIAARRRAPSAPRVALRGPSATGGRRGRPPGPPPLRPTMPTPLLAAAPAALAPAARARRGSIAARPRARPRGARPAPALARRPGVDGAALRIGPRPRPTRRGPAPPAETRGLQHGRARPRRLLVDVHQARLGPVIVLARIGGDGTRDVPRPDRARRRPRKGRRCARPDPRPARGSAGRGSEPRPAGGSPRTARSPPPRTR